MRGTFSEEALLKFSELVSIRTTADFSEGETFDFTRCIRPDGSAYGTSGKCKSGTEGDRLAKNKNTAREMRKGLVERVKSHMKMANETTDSGAKEFYKGEARAAAKKLKTLGRAEKTGKVAKAPIEKSPSAKERQANPGKETFDKGVRDRRENFDTRTRPKDPSSDGPARAAYLKQTLDNEIKHQNRPEIVAGLKKKLAEAKKPGTAPKPSPAVIAREEAKLAKLKEREAAAEERLSTARGARAVAGARAGSMVRGDRENRAIAAANRAAGKASEATMARIEQERKLNELKGIKPKVEEPRQKTKETTRREQLSKVETSINNRAKKLIEKHGENSPEFERFGAKYGPILEKIQDEKQKLIGK